MHLHKENLRSIQLMRGIACILVALMHITRTFNETYGGHLLGNIFNFGGCGVDIFFVLSGFIITYSNQNYIGKTENTVTFLKKRAIRIFPIYWIIVIFFLSLQLLFPSFYKTQFHFSLGNLLYTFFLLPNHQMINGVSWSLTNELFFYFIFSFAFLIPKVKHTFLLLGCYLSVLIVFNLIPFHSFPAFNRSGFTTLVLFPMNIEFLLGILVVIFLKRFPLKWCRPFIFTAIGLFIISATLYNFNQGFFQNNFNRVLVFGVPSFLLILGIVKYELVLNINLHNFLLQIGNASYSIYLIHLPIVVAFFKVIKKLPINNHLPLVGLSCLLLIMVCLVGMALYKYIESPVIRLLNNRWVKHNKQ